MVGGLPRKRVGLQSRVSGVEEILRVTGSGVPKNPWTLLQN